MLKIDKKTFESVVLSATSSTAHVFEMLQPHLDETEQNLKSELFGSFDYTTVVGLESIVVRLVCLRTYYEQIPHLDLVLTPTGFGVVSNENVAPASPDRVKALRQQVKDASEDALDEAIMAMLGTDWAKSISGRVRVNSFYFVGADLRDFAGFPDAHRSALTERLIQIAEAEEYIRRGISSEFFEVLLEGIRNKDLIIEYRMILHELKLAIGGWLHGNKEILRMKLANVINEMERNIDSYPEYQKSEAYKVKHFEHYDNGKDDTTFFFG